MDSPQQRGALPVRACAVDGCKICNFCGAAAFSAHPIPYCLSRALLLAPNTTPAWCWRSDREHMMLVIVAGTRPSRQCCANNQTQAWCIEGGRCQRTAEHPKWHRCRSGAGARKGFSRCCHAQGQGSTVMHMACICLGPNHHFLLVSIPCTQKLTHYSTCAVL